jgi:hypothetical protein
MTKFQIRVAYVWRKYIKRKKARLAAEAAAKAKKLAAKNAKGKKGKLKIGSKKKAATLKPKETKDIVQVPPSKDKN